jgi:hypothetical protein
MDWVGTQVLVSWIPFGACWNGEPIWKQCLVGMLLHSFGFWQIVSYQVQVDSLGTYGNLDVKLDEIGPMDIFCDC